MDNQLLIAQYYYDKYKDEECCAILQKIVDEYPNRVEAKLMLGEIYIRLDEYEKAKEILSLIEKNDKYSGRINFNFANIELIQGNYDKAYHYYKEAISLGYVDARLFVNLESLNKAERKENDALQLLENNRENYSKEDYYSMRGNILFAKGMVKAAELDLRKAKEKGLEGIFSVAYAHMVLEDYEKARECFNYIAGFEMKDKLHYTSMFISATLKRVCDHDLSECEELIQKMEQDINDFDEDNELIFYVLCLMIFTLELVGEFQQAKNLVDILEEIAGEEAIFIYKKIIEEMLDEVGITE